MRRRLAVTAAALAALLVVPASPATAAEATVVEPEDEVTEATELRVRVDRRIGEEVERVRVGLETTGEERELVGERIDLTCVHRCGERDAQIWEPADGALLDPHTGAPFRDEGPLANGAHRLEVRVAGRFLGEPEPASHEITLAAAPAAPTGVTAERDGQRVGLSWDRSPEPDREGYRVERHDGDGWRTVATTASRTSHTDEPGEGEHRYRVVAMRSDGDEGTLETASEPTTVRVSAPGDDQDGDPGDGSTGDGGPGSSSGGPSVGSDSASGSVPSVSRSRDEPDRDVPAVGDGDYDDELGYGEVEDVPEPGGDEVVLADPGGRGGLDRLFDAERVAVPIAVGLVMTATGLHLWRWLRVPLP